MHEYALKSKMEEADIWVDATGNMNKEDSDTPEVAKDKDLINKEYPFCLKIVEDLIKKANRLYDSQMTTGKVKKFCCDFKILEQVCDTYEI